MGLPRPWGVSPRPLLPCAWTIEAAPPDASESCSTGRPISRPPACGVRRTLDAAAALNTTTPGLSTVVAPSVWCSLRLGTRQERVLMAGDAAQPATAALEIQRSSRQWPRPVMAKSPVLFPSAPPCSGGCRVGMTTARCAGGPRWHWPLRTHVMVEYERRSSDGGM